MGSDTPHRCLSTPTCNTQLSNTLQNTLTHTRRHSLKRRVWNWAGTWNEYSKQLSFSPASSNPFHMNIFTSAAFHSSLPSLLLPLICTFSPPSFSPHSPVMVSFPRALRQKCDNTAITRLTYGSRYRSHIVHTVVNASAVHALHYSCSCTVLKHEQQQLWCVRRMVNFLIFLFIF